VQAWAKELAACRSPWRPTAGQPSWALSRAELAVARTGRQPDWTNKEVANELYVSVKTVESTPNKLHQARHHLSATLADLLN